MIVQSMTPTEVYREIANDMPFVAEWWMKKRQGLIRIAKWTTRIPQTKWYEHESQRHNRYLVMSTIMGRNYNNDSLTCVVALQKRERGWAVYVTRWPWQNVANKIVLLPHVFDRYADPRRGNVRKTGIELIKHFICRFGHGESTTDEKFSGRSVRYKDRDNLCLCVQDGVLLGEMQEDIFIAHTFITYDMASGLQKEEFERNKEKVLTNEEVMYKIKEMMDLK